MAGEPLRLVCSDLEAPPLFERAAASRLASGSSRMSGAPWRRRLGRPLVWVFRPWAEMLPSVVSEDGDGVLCGQGITDQRLQVVDFTRPYAVFNESVLVRPDSGIVIGR